MDATVIGLTAVGVAVTGETPRVLVVRQVPPTVTPAASAGASVLEGMPAPHCDLLPFGPFDPQQHRTLESGLRQWVEQQTGLGCSAMSSSSIPSATAIATMAN